MWTLPFDRHAACQPIDVTQPQATTRGRQGGVSAVVAGRDVWFTARDCRDTAAAKHRDVPLVAAPEAFGSALLVPALAAGRPLRLAGSPCETWAANLMRLTEAFRTLWYPAAAGPLVVPGPPAAPRPAGPTVLCFSGGVDAFHTLLAGGQMGGQTIDTLVLVVGYDVPVADRGRATAVGGLLAAVAAETGCRGLVMATNLRRHPLVRATPWLRAFGGPLAAIGHLLGPAAGRILISSDGLAFEHPEIGSRPTTDPLFSSAALAVEHVAPGVTRLEKIRAIAAEPIVRRHLRVCWKNVGDRLNCGRCEKCVRTMLALDACGTLSCFPTFDYGRGLTAAIDELPAVDGVTVTFYRELLASGLSAAAAAAVRRLLERSAAAGTAAGATATTGSAAVAAVPAATPRRKTGSRAASWMISRPAPAVAHRLLAPDAFAMVCEPLVGRRVGYVRPIGNVGDRLIEMAMIQLFAAYGIRWRLWRPEVPGDGDGLDLLVFGGGGNMGSRYANNHTLRSRAIDTGLPVVILPQSFTAAEERPFARVFVRERASLALRPDAILAPDLALGLATTLPARPDRDLGVFLRRDQERTGRKPLWARDPVRLHDDPFAYLAFAARYRRLVTDRLHFAVAGLHAGREVTLVANDYHKNRSMHETWLADLGCRFADTAAAARARAA
jgi:hypothetical protein